MELVEDGSPIGGFLDDLGPSTGKKSRDTSGKRMEIPGEYMGYI